MKINLWKILAVLMAAVTLLGVLSGCGTAEPETTPTGSSVEGTDTPTTDGTDPTTGTTEAPRETDPATDPTPGEDPSFSTESTEPSTELTEPSTEPSTDPTEETGACAHKWSDWTVKTEATCSSTGSRERKCSACGDVEKKTIDKLDHAYGSWTTTKQATCSTKGQKDRTCSTCGKKQTEGIDTLDHKYGSWTTTKAATCDTKGVKSRTCSDCGKTETQSIDSTGHAWDGGKVTTQSDSCSATGVKTYTCTICSHTKTEQMEGNHAFGDWKYEEYTYTRSDEHGSGTVKSHRKVRACTKCGYKEYGNTPDHSCKQGSKNHTITTVKEGTCSTKAIMRSTCKICGWYVEYEGRKSECNWVDQRVHLSDYGPYTNELDATVSECKSCGQKTVSYYQGKGWSDYNRYRVPLFTSVGNAYAGLPSNNDLAYVDYPTWQMVARDFKYDADGYVKQYTQYWWYNGNRYSQVIKCGKGEIESWFAEYGLTGGDGCRYSLKVSGTKIVPYKVSWSG